MRFAADLHVHSRYSRATSRDADLEGYFRWARVKGIRVVGTGDFTHPRWLSEIAAQTVEKDGLLAMKEPPRGSPLEGAEPADLPVRFLLTAEISSIYKKRGQTRKVHSLLGVPSIEEARRLGVKLASIGNISSDGRPILGLDPKDLLEILLEASPEGFLVPAHVWTPGFSLFGSRSGFDRIEDCFEELTPRIFALETGLSSDPPMNWRWSALDRFRLVSNSDAHSPGKLGREACLFDAELSYRGVVGALSTGAGFLGTVEFYPEEGKYHFDGHRKCGVCMDPEETSRSGGACPVCGKPLTVGVLSRVLALADRRAPAQPRASEGFRYLVPLPEILAELAGTGTGSRAVAALHAKAVGAFGSEYALLLDAPIEEIEMSLGKAAGEAVRRMRAGKVDPRPGYDGEFGVIRLFDDVELAALRGQDELFSSSRAARRPAVGRERAAVPTAVPAAVPGAGKPQRAAVTLDEAQRAVVEAPPGASAVIAGPGTGKTRVLVSWIARLVETGEADPAQVLALTFTNRAAAEMSQRLAALLGPRAAEITATTFHSFSWSILRERDHSLLTVYGAEDRERLLGILLPRQAAGRARALSRGIERHYEGVEAADAAVREALAVYEEGLGRIGGADVSSLVHRLAGLLRGDTDLRDGLRARFRFLAVDELQDINWAQYDLLALLSGLGANQGPVQGRSAPPSLLCIGDPDQAIYGFRGSDRGLFFRFRDEARARVFRLATNYRSSRTIVRAAGAIMAAAGSPDTAPLAASRPAGEKITVFRAGDPEEEGRFIASTIRDLVGGVDSVSVEAARTRGEGSRSFSDIAVLFRTRAVRDALLPPLTRAGLPLALRENAPLAAEEPFRSLVAALRLIVNPRDAVSLGDLREHAEAFAPAEAIGDFLARRESLLETAQKRGVCALIDEVLDGPVRFDSSRLDVSLGEEAIRGAAAESGGDLPGFLARVSLCTRESEGPHPAEKVTLLTFHAAKGLEFPVVFVAGAEEGITPLPDDLEEERRLFYVAVTRAEETLFISHCRSRRVHGETRAAEPSRFLGDIPQECRAGAARRGLPRRSSQLPLFG